MLIDTSMRKTLSCVALWWTVDSPSHTSFLIAGEEKWKRASAGELLISPISHINTEHFISLCAIPRMNVGGKLLTNHLKETISYRYTCHYLSKEILWCFLQQISPWACVNLCLKGSCMWWMRPMWSIRSRRMCVMCLKISTRTWRLHSKFASTWS